MGCGTFTRTCRMVQMPNIQPLCRWSLHCHLSQPLYRDHWPLPAEMGTGNSQCTMLSLTPEKPPPHAALPQIREKVKKPKTLSAKPHCAKTFVDDLSVLSSNKSDHQSILNSIQQSCTILDLVLKPAKCLSFCFSGKANIPDQCFNVGDKLTTNVSCKPAKFLGRMKH